MPDAQPQLLTPFDPLDTVSIMESVMYSNVEGRNFGTAIREIVRSRGLLWDLVSKDLRARYRNAVMGFVWAVLQPLLMMLILYFVFGKIFGGRIVGNGGREHHYALTLLTGLIFWQFFAAALGRATTSLIDNADLIKKVYFPREIIPLASMGNSVVNLGIGFAVLVAIYCSIEKHLPGIGILWVGVVFVIQCVLITGLALLCSSLNVRFRDVGYAVDVVLMMGFYATPIFYSAEDLQRAAADYPALLSVFALNPLVGIVSGYRTALLDNAFPPLSEIGWPIVCSLAVFMLGIVIFRRASSTIADHL
jgi:ABC-type polysaccharide/polyol phosphate export permease